MSAFIQKVKTQAEKDALIAKARQQWNELGMHSHLVAASEEEFLEKIANGIEVEGPVLETPTALTSEESAKLDYEVTMLRIFGDRWAGDHWADDSTGCKVLDEAWKQHQAAELEKFLAPAQRERNATTGMIEDAIEKAVASALRKSSGSGNLESNRVTIPVRKTADREGILPRMAAMAAGENPESDVARFLAAFVAGDELRMRRLVHELTAA